MLHALQGSQALHSYQAFRSTSWSQIWPSDISHLQGGVAPPLLSSLTHDMVVEEINPLLDPLATWRAPSEQLSEKLKGVYKLYGPYCHSSHIWWNLVECCWVSFFIQDVLVKQQDLRVSHTSGSHLSTTYPGQQMAPYVHIHKLLVYYIRIASFEVKHSGNRLSNRDPKYKPR